MQVNILICIYFSANKDSKEKGGKGGSKETVGKGKRTGSAKSIERPASVSIDTLSQVLMSNVVYYNFLTVSPAHSTK